MKYPVRHVYTVVRPYSEKLSVQGARSEAQWVADETGEWLYDQTGTEKITASVQIFRKGIWEEVKP